MRPRNLSDCSFQSVNFYPENPLFSSLRSPCECSNYSPMYMPESAPRLSENAKIRQWLAADVSALIRVVAKFWELNVILNNNNNNTAYTPHDASMRVAMKAFTEDTWEADVCPTWMMTPHQEESYGGTGVKNNNKFPDPPFNRHRDLPPYETFPSSFIRKDLLDFPFKDVVVRREPFLFFYLPVPCPLGQQCRNYFCILSHSSFERMFHPLVYRSARCDHVDSNGLCPISRCAFAHSPQEKQPAENWWLMWESHWQGWRSRMEDLRHFCAVTCGSHAAALLADVTRFRYGDFSHHKRIAHEQLMMDAASVFIERLLPIAPGITYPSRFESHITRQLSNPLHLVIIGNRVWRIARKTSEILLNKPLDEGPISALIMSCWMKMVGGPSNFAGLEQNARKLSQCTNAVDLLTILISSSRFPFSSQNEISNQVPQTSTHTEPTYQAMKVRQ